MHTPTDLAGSAFDPWSGWRQTEDVASNETHSALASAVLHRATGRCHCLQGQDVVTGLLEPASQWWWLGGHGGGRIVKCIEDRFVALFFVLV